MSFSHLAKLAAWELLYRAGVFPSRWQLGNPFKIAELTYFLRDTKINSKDRIFDIGCGKGIQTQVFARRAELVVGVDLNADAIKAANSLLRLSKMGGRVRFLAADISEDDLIFDAEFDHVFSISVIEHVTEYHRLLAKASDLLKPGGWIHLSVDSLAIIQDETVLERHRKEYGVAKYFSATEITNALQGSGFCEISVYPIFTGPFSREEFGRRITKGNEYGGGPFLEVPNILKNHERR